MINHNAVFCGQRDGGLTKFKNRLTGMRLVPVPGSFPECPFFPSANKGQSFHDQHFDKRRGDGRSSDTPRNQRQP
ncbi:hypothetical protein CUJ84_Chr000383 [Rhizobium leguminosarum]|uniref:Uncharacterized protein n=1 Tax=Rhizobium leguminosarum TaxID=384 RepID=A0A2K9YXT8_RHILE|nr:hypothetical protein CUJ84_Chr000383 [Rhizobium leguminosarum]